MVEAIRAAVDGIVGLSDLWSGEHDAVELPEDYGEMPMAVRNVIEDEVLEMCQMAGGGSELAEVMISTALMAFLMGRRFGHLERQYPFREIAEAVPMACQGMPSSIFLRLLEQDE